jgi:hypothetical protein
MKAYFFKRPWMIIVIVQALFMIWWIGFTVFASYHTPLDVEPSPPAHAHR